MSNDIISRVLGELARLDTCTVSTAVDALGIRMLNEGFIGSSIPCRTPGLAPMVGVAMTLKVRSAEPPMREGFYLEHSDWWEHLGEAPFPRVLVIEDLDRRPGRGALVGPVHACMLRAMGFSGIVTSGAVRGTQGFFDIGLQAFSANVSPAHAYCHVVEMGGPVELLGLAVRTGDIVHGDASGIVAMPAEAATRVPHEAARFLAREHAVCGYCSVPGFTLQGLRSVIRAEDSRR